MGRLCLLKFGFVSRFNSDKMISEGRYLLLDVIVTEKIESLVVLECFLGFHFFRLFFSGKFGCRFLVWGFFRGLFLVGVLIVGTLFIGFSPSLFKLSLLVCFVFFYLIVSRFLDSVRFLVYNFDSFSMLAVFSFSYLATFLLSCVLKILRFLWSSFICVLYLRLNRTLLLMFSLIALCVFSPNVLCVSIRFIFVCPHL